MSEPWEGPRRIPVPTGDGARHVVRDEIGRA
jgi:hypothetical protein